jgi:hypothetical protein
MEASEYFILWQHCNHPPGQAIQPNGGHMAVSGADMFSVW